MVAVRARSNTKLNTKGKRRNAARAPVDSDIRELTTLIYAAMVRFQVIRRTLAASVDLTPPEFAVVMSLHRLRVGQGARIGELADNIHAAAANVTATVKALGRKGWVIKEPDPLDSRALLVELTAASRERLDRYFDTIHPVNEVWFRNIPKSDRSTVKRFLARLIDQYPQALHQARSLKLASTRPGRRSPASPRQVDDRSWVRAS